MMLTIRYPTSQKTNYDVKISDTEAKYFTTLNYNKFTNKIIDNEIKEK